LEEVKREIVKQLRVNERILAKQVRLVGEKGEQLGIMSVAQAREEARKQSLDLVEVAPNSVPPVCRLLDYGKYKYEQAKKEQQAKKTQKLSLLREIRLRPKIGIHDFEAKARTARKLLTEGDKVKITLMFRGREATHPELGWKVLQRMVESLNDMSHLERQPVMEGRRMNIIMAPGVAKAKVKEEVKEEPQEAVKETTKEGTREAQHAET
jgi:translation initiation factor IF-3